MLIQYNVVWNSLLGKLLFLNLGQSEDVTLELLHMIKISSDIPERIKVVFSYNPEYVAKIKVVKAHRWHPEEKHWSFPYSKPVLKEILSAFSGEALVQGTFTP